MNSFEGVCILVQRVGIPMILCIMCVSSTSSELSSRSQSQNPHMPLLAPLVDSSIKLPMPRVVSHIILVVVVTGHSRPPHLRPR
jgi:hypothetical protein